MQQSRLIRNGKRIHRFRRWTCGGAAVVPFVFYAIFVLIILTVTFPLRSIDNTITAAKSAPPLIRHDEETIKLLVHNKEPSSSSSSVRNDIQYDSNEVKQLIDIFTKADFNKNNALSIDELAHYINRQIREHIEAAIRMNPLHFAEIDSAPRDGLVSWTEWHRHFLRQKGMSAAAIDEHSEQQLHSGLDRSAKEEMMKDKALWTDAARTDSFSLTLDEFLSFRHPEASAVNLLSLVDDLLRQFDNNMDDLLTIDEFSQLNLESDDGGGGGGEERWSKYVITKTVFDRKEEFRRIIDVNKDGQANRSELLAYIDPRHPRHALEEAGMLFEQADKNDDKKLSLEEVLAMGRLFIASKMIRTAESIHEEF